MKTQIYFILKKYFPYFAKYLFNYFKKYNFDFNVIKKHLKDDIHLLIVDEIEKLTAENPEGYLGAILDEDENEYLVGGETDGEVEIYPNPIKTTAQLNQLEFKNTFGRALCTLYGPMAMAIDNLGVDLDRAKRYVLAEKRYNAPDFKPKIGGYTSVGHNIVRKYVRDELKTPVLMYKFYKNSKTFWGYLNNGWRLDIGFRADRALLVDMADGTIDKPISGKTIFGHNTTIKKIAGGAEIQLVDSYKGVKKYNCYNFKNFEEFIKSPFVYGNVRVFVPADKKTIMDLPNSILTQKLGSYNGKNGGKAATRFEAASMAGGNTKKVFKLLLKKKLVTEKDLENL